MELQQMRYVIAVAEERSFTRAAERCRVVQSALSHQIKALERELGTTLFARTSRRVETTAAGDAFIAHARASIEAAERASSAAAAAVGEIRGTLTVGVIPTVTAIDIPAVLGAFHRAHPAVRIRLRSGGSDEFIAAIVAGEMDAAVLGLADTAPPQGVASKALAHERLAAVVPAGHRFAHRRTLRLEELTGETFVDFPEGRPGRLQSDLAFRRTGLQRDVAFEAMSAELMLDLVKHNLVIALLSPERVPESEELRTIPLADGPKRVEYLAWSEFNPSPAARAFLTSASSIASEGGGEAAQ